VISGITRNCIEGLEAGARDILHGIERLHHQKLVPFAYFLRGLILFGYVWTAGRFLLQA
jgi:hypothetical protein